jgi:hypothetical protein
MQIKTDSEEFVRDSSTGALINSNVNNYKLYKQQRESAKTFGNLREEVDSLKNDISDIKSMLSVLIKQNSKET